MTDQPYHQAEGQGQTEQDSVDPALLQRALDRIKTLAAGNGIDPETITLKSFDGAMLHFAAYNFFTIKPNVTEKSVPGKEQAEICGSASDLHLKITAAIEKTISNPDVIDTLTELLERRKDKGFMVQNINVKLDRLTQKFVHYNSCTQCSSGKMLCAHCQGAGEGLCNKCRGHGTTPCLHCRGARVIRQSDGKTLPCRHCTGKGRVSCILCHATGKTQCTPCQGSGRVQCQKCATTGIISEIAHVSFEAENNFIYESDALPPDIPPLIDRLGADFILKEHGTIRLLNKNEQQEIQRAYHHVENPRFKNGLLVPCHIRLAWGEIVFARHDREKTPKETGGGAGSETLLTAKLFGLHPRLLNLPPFLEGALAPGLDRLTQAAHNLGSVRANMTEALHYRAIADAVLAAATLPPKKASQTIRGRWALGIRPAIAHKMVQLAEKSVQNLTRKARLFGLGIGLLASAVLFAVYLIGGLRLLAAAHGLNSLMLLLLDICLMAVAAYATTLLSRLAGRKALSSLLEHSPAIAGQPRKIIPRAGHNAPLAFLGVVLIFAATILFAAMTGQALPEWAGMLFEKAGLQAPQ